MKIYWVFVIVGLILLSSCTSCSKQKTRGEIKFETSQLDKIVDLEPVDDVNEDREPRAHSKTFVDESETYTGRPRGVPMCNV
jgi:hypothetical protein